MKSSLFNIAALPALFLLLSGSGAQGQSLKNRQAAYAAKARPLADPWSIASSKEQNLLLEMYTALNCPACPPADAWMDYFAELDFAKGKTTDLWTKLVPVVWHVTYFDRPGQRDPLGLYDFTMRQEYLAQASGQDNKYTPAFYTNGREWLGLRKGEPLSMDTRITGELKLANLGGDKGMTIEFTPAAGFDPQPYRGEMRGWLVLQVGSVYTDPRRGPEAVQPRVDTFAVQAWKSARITNTNGKWTGQFDALPIEKIRQEWPGATYSIAAWVTTDPLAFRPVQAVGSWVK